MGPILFPGRQMKHRTPPASGITDIKQLSARIGLQMTTGEIQRQIVCGGCASISTVVTDGRHLIGVSPEMAAATLFFRDGWRFARQPLCGRCATRHAHLEAG